MHGTTHGGVLTITAGIIRGATGAGMAGMIHGIMDGTTRGIMVHGMDTDMDTAIITLGITMTGGIMAIIGDPLRALALEVDITTATITAEAISPMENVRLRQAITEA